MATALVEPARSAQLQLEQPAAHCYRRSGILPTLIREVEKKSMRDGDGLTKRARSFFRFLDLGMSVGEDAAPR